MSESDAVWPSFITWVESLTLSWSESWLPDRSILSTFPVTWPEPEVLPIEPIEPELEEPEEPVPIDPEDPLEPEEPPVPIEPDPLEPELPPDADCPAAGNATSSPATPRLATIPLLIFMCFPLTFAETDPAPSPVVVVRAHTLVLGPGRDTQGAAAPPEGARRRGELPGGPGTEVRTGGALSDRLAT